MSTLQEVRKEVCDVSVCQNEKQALSVCYSFFPFFFFYFLLGIQIHVCIWSVLCFVCTGSNRFIAKSGVTGQL